MVVFLFCFVLIELHCRFCGRCFWSGLACTRSFFSASQVCARVWVCALPVHGWRALTEGHGSCTLSVWTLAEPLGVLFQARSDNLAPMTRLATAQFTGRSSTHAHPTLLILPPPPCASHPYPPSPLHSSRPLSSTFLSHYAVFFLCSCLPFLFFFLFFLFQWHCCQQRRKSACWHSGGNAPCRPAN